MQGGLGIGNNLNKWTPEDFATAKRMVAEYKSIRETVQRGDQYLLISTLNNSPYSAMDYVSPDKKQAVLFAYLHSSEDGNPYPRLFLEGLDPAVQYTVHSIEGKMDPSTPVTASGDYWMHHGVDVLLRGDFQAAGFVFTRQ